MFTVIMCVALIKFHSISKIFLFISIATNQDLFNRLMVSSDPLISSIGKVSIRKRLPLKEEAINLLKEPNISDFLSSDDEDIEDKDS